MYGTDDAKQNLYENFKDDFEFQFYNYTLDAVDMITCCEKIPPEFVMEYQQLFEKMGGVGDVMKLVESVNQ